MMSETGSSGSDERKRMVSNRESARRSRMKKQNLLEDLVNEVNNMQDQNSRLFQSIDLAASRYTQIDSANNIFRCQVAELTDRLRSLNTVLEIVEEVSGFEMDIPEIPDPLLKPLQLPSPVQPITADVFQY